MIARIRNLPRLQKVGVVGGGCVFILLFCCSCMFFTSLLPSSSEDGEVAETTENNTNTEDMPNSDSLESESAQESVDTVETEPTQTLALSTDTPRPSNTPKPTNTSTPVATLTASPTHTPVPELATITLDSGDEVTGDLATVTRIIDGDTIEVEINGETYRVRYIGMDTPEEGDDFYDQATEANSQLVEGQTVLLVKDVSETDRFGRLLRYVYLQDGTFVNAELVKQGFALAATFPPDVAFQDLFVALQQEARDEGNGLWEQPEPTNTLVPVPTATLIPLPTNTPLPPIATDTPVPLPTSTPEPPPPATSTPEPPPTGNCDPSYPDVCIAPPPPDLDCGDIPYRQFRVLEPDPHRFDGDNDGIGCES